MSFEHRLHRLILAMTVLVLLISLPACSLSRNRTPASPAGTPQAAPGEGGVSPDVLTEVAATLYAPLQGTLTQQALAPQAVKPTTPTPMLEPRPTESGVPPAPTEATPTAAPTDTEQPPVGGMPTQGPSYPPPVAQPTATLQQGGIAYVLTPTSPGAGLPQSTIPAGQGSGFPPPATYMPAFPPGGYTVDAGKPFTIAGVNLPSCGGTFTANFLIINQSGSPFESLSVQLNDLSTGQSLATALISDAPFMFDDRACFPGGTGRLESGYALFAGVSLAAGRLSGHSLQANLLFCSQNGLGGRCFPKSVEFVVP